LSLKIIDVNTLLFVAQEKLKLLSFLKFLHINFEDIFSMYKFMNSSKKKIKKNTFSCVIKLEFERIAKSNIIL